MDPTTEIASGFSVNRYDEIRTALDPTSPTTPSWVEVLAAFRRRIEERFLRPIDQLVSVGRASGAVAGFAILALDCLLIDTLQSFREGRVSTGEVSPARSFKNFLRSTRFSGFDGSFNSEDRDEFFAYVRNALLHNGETRGDWKVRIDSDRLLTKSSTGTRTLNRNLFHSKVKAEFEDYCRDMEGGPADARMRFLRRMDAICGKPAMPGIYYFAYGSNLLPPEIERTAPTAEPVGIAYVPGWRLQFTKHAITRAGDAASIARD